MLKPSQIQSRKPKPKPAYGVGVPALFLATYPFPNWFVLPSDDIINIIKTNFMNLNHYPLQTKEEIHLAAF